MDLEKELETTKQKAASLEEKAKNLQASYDRVLSESKSFKTRAQESETRLQELETKKLEADGETQKLLDQERERNSELAGKLKGTVSKAMSAKLRADALACAKDAHNIDMLLRVTEHKDLLKLDEEALTVNGVEDFVKKARETHPYLFTTDKLPATETKKPKGDSKDDKIDMANYANALAACKTQKELDAVRVTYGRA